MRRTWMFIVVTGLLVGPAVGLERLDGQSLQAVRGGACTLQANQPFDDFGCLKAMYDCWNQEPQQGCYETKRWRVMDTKGTEDPSDDVEVFEWHLRTGDDGGPADPNCFHWTGTCQTQWEPIYAEWQNAEDFGVCSAADPELNLSCAQVYQPCCLVAAYRSRTQMGVCEDELDGYYMYACGCEGWPQQFGGMAGFSAARPCW